MICDNGTRLALPQAPPASQLLGFDHSSKELPLTLRTLVRFAPPLLLPLLLVAASSLSATPRLSLSATSLVVPVVQGSNGPSQSLDAFNIGSGTLNLKATSS